MSGGVRWDEQTSEDILGDLKCAAEFLAKEARETRPNPPAIFGENMFEYLMREGAEQLAINICLAPTYMAAQQILALRRTK